VTAIAILASAALHALAFPPWEIAALSWLALTPLVWALQDARPRAAAWKGACWGFAATLAIIAWVVPTLHEHFERSIATSIGFWVAVSAMAAAPYIALAMAGFALGAARLPAALRPPLFAASWVAAEWARARFGLASPWASLGHAHADTESIRGIAAVAGVYGVSALVAWANAALVEAVAALRESRSRDLAGITVGFAIALGAGLACSLPGTEERAPADPAFEVALVQGNVDARLVWRQSTASRVLRRYGGLTRRLLRDEPRPQLIIWPENAIQTTLEDPLLGPPVLRMVRGGVPLLIGAPRSEEREGRRLHFNSAHLLRVDGSVEHYDKRRLLPFSETHPLGGFGSFDTPGDLGATEYTPGDRAAVFEVARERLGVLICMEALYPELAREALALGATALVNLSNDSWYRGRGGARQHLQQAAFRAIETGLPLMRATTTGISAVIAPDGSIVADTAEGERTTLRTRLPARMPPPFHARHGEVFAWGCVATWVAASMAGCAARIRAVHRPI
jgi:apolipoprotein N-acyltransferase